MSLLVYKYLGSPSQVALWLSSPIENQMRTYSQNPFLKGFYSQWTSWDISLNTEYHEHDHFILILLLIKSRDCTILMSKLFIHYHEFTHLRHSNDLHLESHKQKSNIIICFNFGIRHGTLIGTSLPGLSINSLAWDCLYSNHLD